MTEERATTAEVSIVIAAHTKFVTDEDRLNRVTKCLQRAMQAADQIGLLYTLCQKLKKLKDHKGTLIVDWDESVLSTAKRRVCRHCSVEYPIVCLLVERAWSDEGENLGQHHIGTQIVREWGHE
jgi:hypothetical protein